MSQDEELNQVDSSEEEEEEPLLAVRPYELLLKSFASEKLPHAKRRKMEHVGPLPVAADNTKDGSEILEVEDLSGSDDEQEDHLDTDINSLSDDEEAVEDASDPFETHFANPDDNLLSRRLKAIQESQWTIHKEVLQSIGKVTSYLPQHSDPKVVPSPQIISGFADLHLKQKLLDSISKQLPHLSPLEQSLAPMMFKYQDLLYCERTIGNQDGLRRLVCLHAVNHIFKSVFKAHLSKAVTDTLLEPEIV